MFWSFVGGVVITLYFCICFIIFMSEDWNLMGKRIKDALLWPVAAVFFLLAMLWRRK